MTDRFVPNVTLSASGTYPLIPTGTPFGRDGYQIRVTGTAWTGSLVLVQNIAPPGSAANYVSVPYQNVDTLLQVAAGTAITSDMTVVVPAGGYSLAVQYTHTSGSVALAVSPAHGINADEADDVGFTQGGTGSFEQTVAAKLRETISVRDFGAVGDGVTDDTAAIQRAVTRALAVDTPLFFPAGTFRVTSSITTTTTDRLTVRGAGRSDTTIAAELSSGALFDSLRNIVVFEDLTVTNNATTAIAFRAPNAGCGYWSFNRVDVSGFAKAVEIRRSLWLSFRDLKISDTGSIGFDLTEKNVDGSAPSGGWNVINTGWFNNQIILDNVLVDGGVDGIRAVCTGLVMNSCTVQGLSGDGFVFDAPSGLFTNAVLNGCYAEFVDGYLVSVNNTRLVALTGGHLQGGDISTPSLATLFVDSSTVSLDGVGGFDYVEYKMVLADGIVYGQVPGVVTISNVSASGSSAWYTEGKDIAGELGVQVFGDSSGTLQVNSGDPITAVWSSTLTANRAATLSTTDAFPGSRFHIYRTGGGANFYVDVGGLFRLNTGEWCTVEFNGTAWQVIARGSVLEPHPRVSSDIGDASTTVTVGNAAPTVLYGTALTADRSVTLSATNAYNGARFRIVRQATATGAFNINVGTGPLKALTAAGQWCDVEYNGSAWILTAYGTL